MNINSEYHDNIAAVQQNTAHRLDRASQPHLFDRIGWVAGLHQHCLANDKPLIVSAKIAEDASDKIDHAAEAWLFLVKDGLMRHRALANWYNFTFRPVFGQNLTEVEKLALLASIAVALRRKSYRISIEPVPQEDESASLIERAFCQAGWVVYRNICDQNHILQVNGRSFDEYWKSRPGQLRSTVRRKSKRNEVALRIETKYSDDAWADYEKVYAKSWKPDEGSPDFLKALAQSEGQSGCLRMGLAYVDGEPVAAQFWTVENGFALIHKLAHDEAALKASPGTLLSAALFQHVIDIDKVNLIDFGTGNDRYKVDWMEDVRQRYHLEMFWPHSPLSWPFIGKNWVSDLVARYRNA